MPYTSVCEVRAAGIDEKIASDLKINMLISVWDKFIDKYCEQWFEPRNLDIRFDGNGTNILHLNIPIISITSLYMNDSTSVTPTDDYIVYNNRNDFRDDRQNPKIVSRSNIFTRGFQNQRLVGSFGYVEADGSTPQPIRVAALNLVIEKIMNPIILTPDFEMLSVSLNTQTGGIIEEITDEHSQKFATIKTEARKQGMSGVIRNLEILDILNMYKFAFAIESVG